MTRFRAAIKEINTTFIRTTKTIEFSYNNNTTIVRKRMELRNIIVRD